MSDNRIIHILFLSWRDIRSPKSGGAEVHTHGLLKCLDNSNYRVVHFSPLYSGLCSEEYIDGIRYIRRGNILTVIFWAFLYYNKHKKQIDFVVDQCNTHRFFTRFWVTSKKRIFYIHQLTREIWDINLSFPFNVIGKRLETWMLRLQKRDYVITVSQSTKQDLVDIGFNCDKIFIIPNAISDSILNILLDTDITYKNHDFLYIGRYSKYKGIDSAIKAVGLLKNKYTDIRLRIVGKKDYTLIQDLIMPLANKYKLTVGDNLDTDNNYDITLIGFVSEKEKYKLMHDSLALLFPSIREGWGIIVTEASALGTPGIVFDSPGCRDAIDYGNAGYLCDENTYEDLAAKMKICMDDTEKYIIMRKKAYDFAQQFSWNNNSNKLIEIFNQIIEETTNK